MSTVPVVTPPPPKKGNKLTRWLNTATGRTAVGFIAGGISAVASPDVATVITQAADKLSKGETAGWITILVAGALGIARARSA